jgi:hypothetical protein
MQVQYTPPIAQCNQLKNRIGKEPSINFYAKFSRLRIVIGLTFCLLMTTCALAFPGTAIEAQGVSQSTYQGLVLQVDRTDSSNVTFSLLDHHGTPFTFHLSKSTQFTPHQAASQFTANLLVSVKAQSGVAGILNATSIQYQSKNKAPFELQGVVASVDQNSNLITLALSDGTVLPVTVKHVATIQTGSMIALNAQFSATSSLVASTYRIVAAHAAHFQARGIISHINARIHFLTLVSPSGTAFSIVEGAGQSAALHIGEKVEISGKSDTKGTLNAQTTSVEDATNQSLTVIGMVSLIDTTADTFALVDKQGNSSTVGASADLIASLQVGGVYQLEISIASDGSISATSILSSQGSDQGNTISLEGTIQFYDPTSGLLNLSTDDGQSVSLQISNQTTIVNSDGTAGTLASGQAIHTQVLLHTDGTYSVLKIEIQDASTSGDQMTFVGYILYYDSISGNLVINFGNNHRLMFDTNSNTQVNGASSLGVINSWSLINITVLVQPDGSYLATQVQVMGNYGSNSLYRSMKPYK